MRVQAFGDERQAARRLQFVTGVVERGVQLADAQPERTQQRLENYERMVEEFGPFTRG